MPNVTIMVRSSCFLSFHRLVIAGNEAHFVYPQHNLVAFISSKSSLIGSSGSRSSFTFTKRNIFTFAFVTPKPIFTYTRKKRLAVHPGSFSLIATQLWKGDLGVLERQGLDELLIIHANLRRSAAGHQHLENLIV